MSRMSGAKRHLRVLHLMLLLGPATMLVPHGLDAQATLAVPVARPAPLNGSITLFPSVLELRGKGGQGARHTLTITNSSTQPMSFDLAVLDVVTRNGRRLFVPAGETIGSIAATAVLTPKLLLVPAGQSRSAELTVTMPMATAVRAVVARMQALDPNAGPGRVGVTVGLGSLITFNITDAVSADASPLAVIPSTATTAVVFSEWIANNGQEPFIVNGVVAILDERQRLVTRIDVQRTRFLPGERLELRNELAGHLPAGQYRAVLTLSYEGRILTRTADWQSR
jgi:hypothetical protein